MIRTVVVASTNPVKASAAMAGFKSMFPSEEFEFVLVPAKSDVRDQPLSDTETLVGATNRVVNAEKLHPGAPFYIGLEGGVEDIENELHEFAWIVIRSNAGRTGKAKTCTFLAPPIFRRLVIEEGKEVGDVSDIVFGQKNSKQIMGAIGLLTNGVIDRAELYRHAVVAALIPFGQTDLY